MAGYRAYFSMELPLTQLPVDKDGWISWWHSRNVLKADTFGINDDILLTDYKALTQPKRFFEEATKPMASKHIDALNVKGKVIVSDTGIEDVLHNYVKHLAAPGSPLPEESINNEDGSPHVVKPRKQQKNSWSGFGKHLDQLMNAVDSEELLTVVRESDYHTAAGVNGISPGLLKIVLTVPWTVENPKSTEDITQDKIMEKFHSFFQGALDSKRKRTSVADIPIEDIPLPPNHKKNIKLTLKPQATITALLRILNLFLKAKTVPDSEKEGYNGTPLN
jgi:hypothetical protein